MNAQQHMIFRVDGLYFDSGGILRNFDLYFFGIFLCLALRSGLRTNCCSDLHFSSVLSVDADLTKSALQAESLSRSEGQSFLESPAWLIPARPGPQLKPGKSQQPTATNPIFDPPARLARTLHRFVSRISCNVASLA